MNITMNKVHMLGDTIFYDGVASFSLFVSSLCHARKKIMYVLSWWTRVCARVTDISVSITLIAQKLVEYTPK